MSGEPLYPTALIGFRFWLPSLDGELLAFARKGASWSPGINHAACGEGRPHKAPDADCECGLYAYHSVDAVLDKLDLQKMYDANPYVREVLGRHRFEPVVIGAVAGSGLVQLSWSGWRAEQAQILGLVLPDGDSPRLAKVRERYPVPILETTEALEGHAARYGSRLDPEQLPPHPLRAHNMPALVRAYRQCNTIEEVAQLGEKYRITSAAQLAELCFGIDRP